MDQKEIRWRQRYISFEKAYLRFGSVCTSMDQLNMLEKEGMLQRFEYTFELAWKTLKDYLKSQKVEVSFPREVIKAAFHYGLIKDGEMWMDMLDKRILLSHTYDEDTFNTVTEMIKKGYFDAITQVYMELGEKR